MKVLKKTFIKSCILLCTLFMSSISALAQGDFIYEIHNLDPKNAIVRYWRENQYVIYSEDGVDSYFSLVDYSAMTCTSFKCKYLGVHDFEIDGKDVFFCGNDGTEPIFGYFNIPTLFSSGLGMNKIGMGGWLTSSNDERIIDLNKLEMHRVSDGNRVYMIGESEFVASPTVTRHTHCIVDMRYNVSSGWFYNFVQEKSATVLYDDVAITDNWVVVVARKNGTYAHYTHSFPKPSMVGPTVLPSGFVPYYYGGTSNGYYTDPNHPLLLEHLFGDYYAMSEYTYVDFGVFPWDRGSTVSVYSTASMPLQRTYISQGHNDTAYWKQKDLRYNPNVNKLYLLQDISNPVSTSLESVICIYDIDATTGMIFGADAYYIPSDSYSSLDRCDNSLEAIAVGGGPSMHLWHHNMGSECVREKPPKPIPLILDESKMDYYYQPLSNQCTLVSVSGEIFEYELEKICEE